MAKVIVFTDTHMQPETKPGKFDPARQLEKGIAHVNTFNGDADHVIFCGDLTHRGTVESYEMLRDSLENLKLPYTLLMGNHDNRENFLSVFPKSQRDENGFLQKVIKFPEARLVLLDTLNGPPYNYPESHKGLLCEKRLDWLDRQLTDAGEQPCIIFMHHPPHDTGFKAMDTIKLTHSESFYELVQKHGNVRQLVCGHIHRTISGSYNGIPFCVFKSTVGQMPMVFESMDFRAEVNEPSAYGIVFAGKAGVIVHTEDFELSDLHPFKV